MRASIRRELWIGIFERRVAQQSGPVAESIEPGDSLLLVDRDFCRASLASRQAVDEAIRQRLVANGRTLRPVRIEASPAPDPGLPLHFPGSEGKALAIARTPQPLVGIVPGHIGLVALAVLLMNVPLAITPGVPGQMPGAITGRDPRDFLRRFGQVRWRTRRMAGGRSTKRARSAAWQAPGPDPEINVPPASALAIAHGSCAAPDLWQGVNGPGGTSLCAAPLDRRPDDSPLALLIFLAMALCSASAAAPTSPAVQTAHLQSRLVAETIAAVPGTRLTLGLLLEHDPHWHTYWRNPGDSGLPIEITLELPDGVIAGPIAWPHPQRFDVAGIPNFGYDGRRLLPISITIPADYGAPSLPVRASAKWLICEVECIPGKASYTIRTTGSADGRDRLRAGPAISPPRAPTCRALLRRRLLSPRQVMRSS